MIFRKSSMWRAAGTGWHGATNVDHICMIKEAVEDSVVALKVAGGLTPYCTVLQMYVMGVARFAVGYEAALKIINEFVQRNEQ